METEAVVLDPSFYLWPFKMRVFLWMRQIGVFVQHHSLFKSNGDQERSFVLYKNV